MHLLLGADDQVAIGQHGLQMRRRPRSDFDVALVAGGMAGKAPEIRPVVDVEDDLAAVCLGDADRLALRGVACCGGRNACR